MSTIGNRIRNRRLELGLSVDDLACKLGKNRATVYRYESDEIENFPVSVIKPLADILDVSPAYLMGWTETPITENNPTENDEVEEEYLLASRSKDGKRGIEILTKAEYETAKAFIQTLRKNTNEDL